MTEVVPLRKSYDVGEPREDIAAAALQRVIAKCGQESSEAVPRLGMLIGRLSGGR